MTFRADSLGKTVLMVDSDRKLREARAHRLALYGVTVHTANGVEEARRNLRNNTYDLVLLATRENQEMAIVLRWEIHQQNPKQKVAFLVGPPNYISFTYGNNVLAITARSDKLKWLGANA